MKKFLVVLLALLLLVGVCGCASPETTEPEDETAEPAEKIKLTAVGAWQKNSTEHDGYWMFLEKVEERLGDRVTIEYLGGPEVFPTGDQPELLGKGAFDILETGPGYVTHLVPEALTIYVTGMKPWEEREKGIHDILREAFEEKMNITFLGHTGSGEGFSYQAYTNFKPESIDDFKGKTIRIAPMFDPIFEALGAGRNVMPPGDIYTAMERGVVDGFCWTTLAVTDFGWSEVTKYIVKPSFYDVRISLFFNKDKWYSLPEDIRAELMEIVEEVEKESYEHFSGLVEEEEQQLIEEGMEIVELPSEDAEKFLEIANDAMWNRALEEAPELSQQIKDLVGN